MKDLYVMQYNMGSYRKWTFLNYEEIDFWIVLGNGTLAYIFKLVRSWYKVQLDYIPSSKKQYFPFI